MFPCSNNIFKLRAPILQLAMSCNTKTGQGFLFSIILYILCSPATQALKRLPSKWRLQGSISLILSKHEWGSNRYSQNVGSLILIYFDFRQGDPGGHLLSHQQGWRGRRGRGLSRLPHPGHRGLGAAPPQDTAGADRGRHLMRLERDRGLHGHVQGKNMLKGGYPLSV